MLLFVYTYCVNYNAKKSSFLYDFYFDLASYSPVYSLRRMTFDESIDILRAYIYNVNYISVNYEHQNTEKRVFDINEPIRAAFNRY